MDGSHYMTRRRLVYRHGIDDANGAQARAVLARTIHGLDEHGHVELLEEHSTPTAIYWDIDTDAETWSGLVNTARTMLA